MTQKRKRAILAVGAVLVAAGLGLNVVAYNQAYTMTHFTLGGARTPKAEELAGLQKFQTLFRGVNIPRPHGPDVHTNLGPDGVSLRIPCPDGPTLGAWYCPVPNARCLVLLFHGYAGEKSSLMDEAKVFLDLGCSVLLVDARGSGESSESYTTIGYLEGLDVEAALIYAREHYPHPRVVLYGISMGAASILRAVAARHVHPDGIIAEAVFDTLLQTVRNRFRPLRVPAFPAAELLVFWGGWQTGFNGFKHNPVDYARQVSCPILFLHGGRDPLARIGEARTVFDAVPGPKEFQEFPEATHEAGFTRDPVGWTAAVRRFLAGLERP